MLVLVFKLKLITRFAERAGAWSTWSSWGSCSESCGQGQHSRSRSCVSVNDTGVLADDCVGDDIMTRPCNEFDCPGDHTAEIVRQSLVCCFWGKYALSRNKTIQRPFSSHLFMYGGAYWWV